MAKLSYANAALVLAALLAGTAIAQGATTPPPQPVGKTTQSDNKPDGDLALLQQHCSACHSIDQVTARSKTADEWTETMDRMIDHGMQITPEDNKRITDYLVAHYGTK